MINALERSIDMSLVDCQGPISEKKILKQVYFKELISIYFQNNKPFEAALNEKDRAYKNDRSVCRRSKSDKNAVKYYVRHLKVVAEAHAYEDLSNGFFNKLKKISEEILPHMDSCVRAGAVSFVTEELEELVMQSPTQSLSMLAQALKKRISEHRTRVETIDKRGLLVASSGEYWYDEIVRSAPEFMDLHTECLNWKEGEEKNITLTFIQDRDVGTFVRCIDRLFTSVSLRSLLMEFISFSEEERSELLEEIKDQKDLAQIRQIMVCLVTLVVAVVSGFFLFPQQRK